MFTYSWFDQAGKRTSIDMIMQSATTMFPQKISSSEPWNASLTRVAFSASLESVWVKEQSRTSNALYHLLGYVEAMIENVPRYLPIDHRLMGKEANKEC